MCMCVWVGPGWVQAQAVVVEVVVVVVMVVGYTRACVVRGYLGKLRLYVCEVMSARGGGIILGRTSGTTYIRPGAVWLVALGSSTNKEYCLSLFGISTPARWVTAVSWPKAGPRGSLARGCAVAEKP